MTPRKFATLSHKRKHQECARILLEIHHGASQDAYHLLRSWLPLPPLNELTSAQVANLYHEHLHAADIHLKEHQMLPFVKRFDNQSPQESLGYTIYLDNLRSAHNVGSIFRTAEAFRLGSIILSPSTPDPTQKKVQDTSMGTSEWVPWEKKLLKNLPSPLIAIETAPSAISLFDYQFKAPCTIAFGNEEYGCSEEILDRAETILYIPLRGKKNSLNVANAFAIVASHISKS